MVGAIETVLYRRGVEVGLDTTTAMVVGLEDLVSLKQATGRPIDLADVAALRALQTEDASMSSGGDDFPRGFDGHRRAQVAMGLRLTPAERLRWLEEAMETLRRWRGRARER